CAAADNWIYPQAYASNASLRPTRVCTHLKDQLGCQPDCLCWCNSSSRQPSYTSQRLISSACARVGLPSSRAFCEAARSPSTQSANSARSARCHTPTRQRYLLGTAHGGS